MRQRNRGVYVFGLLSKPSRYKDMLRCFKRWSVMTWDESVAILKLWRR